MLDVEELGGVTLGGDRGLRLAIFAVCPSLVA
jgi:hypothetical protein